MEGVRTAIREEWKISGDRPSEGKVRMKEVCDGKVRKKARRGEKIYESETG